VSKLSIKNWLNNDTGPIVGVVYINNVNEGIIESYKNVMLKFLKNTSSVSNYVALDISDLSSIFKPVRKEFANVVNMLDETILFEG
jgi:hypothetical protein